MQIFIHKRFEDVEENYTTAENYPEIEILCAIYQKIKGYKAPEKIVEFYEKISKPLETFLLLSEERWDSYRTDMREVSQQFPFLYFTVVEEDWNHPIARYCFRNGKMTGGYIRFYYTPFRREELE